jgi:hypothetical protein
VVGTRGRGYGRAVPTDDELLGDVPLDPDDWTDEQWQAHLRDTADLADDPRAEHGSALHRKLRGSAGGTVLGAAMAGLEQALYGEKPKEEVVAEAESDDPDGELSAFDPDDPASATLHLHTDPSAGSTG